MVPCHKVIVMINEIRLVIVTAQMLAVVLSQGPEEELFFYLMKKHGAQTLCRQKQPKITTI